VPSRRGPGITTRLRRDATLLVLLVPGIVFFLLFKFIPYYYNVIAFRDDDVSAGAVGMVVGFLSPSTGTLKLIDQSIFRPRLHRSGDMARAEAASGVGPS